jgi:hypothetical protein
MTGIRRQKSAKMKNFIFAPSSQTPVCEDDDPHGNPSSKRSAKMDFPVAVIFAIFARNESCSGFIGLSVAPIVCGICFCARIRFAAKVNSCSL